MANMSDINIVNSSLTLVGALNILAFDNSTREATIAKTIYDITRPQLLRSWDWNFARKEVLLTLTGDTPIDDRFTSVHLLPSDYLKVLRTLNTNTRYQVNANKISSLESVLNISYTANITVTTLFTEGFIDAFIFKMASKLALIIAQNQKLSESHRQSFILSFDEAKLLDSQEQFGLDFNDANILLSVRDIDELFRFGEVAETPL